MKIIHFTTGHEFTDMRIFRKECRSLAAEGYDTHLVTPGAPETVIDGVNIHGARKNSRRFLSRLLSGNMNMLKTLRNLQGDVYHFHDLELIPSGLFLKWTGRRVIYDVHEDFPRVALEREYLPRYIRRLVSWLTEKIENFAARRYDAIIAVNRPIYDRFAGLGCRVARVTNYPDLNKMQFPPVDWSEKEPAVCYLGALNRNLGLFKMLEAVKLAETKLFLAGEFSPVSHKEEAERHPGWAQVKYLGHIGPSEVIQIYSRSMAGLVLYQPGGNNFEAMPNKLFECLAAGIPVIASHFDLWREIVEDNGCGLCVNPRDPEEIAQAIRYLLTHPQQAEEMGRRGRKAVEEKYNWRLEAQNLFAIYRELLHTMEEAD